MFTGTNVPETKSDNLPIYASATNRWNLSCNRDLPKRRRGT
jgi:hypothetical protein